MQQVTVTTSAVSLPFGNNARPLLQNLGPGIIYFGPTSAVNSTTGFKLPPGIGYEFPQSFRYLTDWDALYVVSDSTADLRFGSVG